MFKVVIDHVTGTSGLTVARRKDGSRAVLWGDDTITWLSPAHFSDMEAHGMVEAL